MNSWWVIALVPLVLSLGITQSLPYDIIPNAEALKSKGTSLPETGSKKVCGDKLCSEISDRERQKFQKIESSVFEHVIEIPTPIDYEEIIAQQHQTHKKRVPNHLIQGTVDLFFLL